MTNAYMKRQAIVRERQQARTERRRDERQTASKLLVMHTLDEYIVCFAELNGRNPQIEYSGGWYKIKRGNSYDSYRQADMAGLLAQLRVKIHAAKMRREVEGYDELMQDQ